MLHGSAYRAVSALSSWSKIPANRRGNHTKDEAVRLLWAVIQSAQSVAKNPHCGGEWQTIFCSRTHNY